MVIERVSHVVTSILKSDSDANHLVIIVVVLFCFINFRVLKHLFILCH